MALNEAMATRLPFDYRTLASLSRINLLHELQVNGAQTVAELAAATGLHHNTAREHLHRLIESGFVDSETVPCEHKGRPKIRYRAATGKDSPARSTRRAASERRSEILHRVLLVEDVSTRQTPMSRQLDLVDDHMDQCGFDAEIAHDGTRMTMHDCPFSQLARNNPQVCEVHFALVKDALDDAGGPLRARELHPFATPHTCTVDMDAPVPARQ